jgi:hypothetical protein
VPAVAAGDWTKGAVLYQFSGLKDVTACLTKLQAYTAGTTGGTVQGWLQTPDACPSIFTLADGSALNKGFYDGNSLQPYTSYQLSTQTLGGPMVLGAGVGNNLKFCDPKTPALAWEPQRNRPVLNCGQWYAPTYLAAGFPRANVPTANNDPNFYTVSAPLGSYGTTTNLPGDCSDNLVSPLGNKYPAITTLTGSWPSGAPSSCALIPSVPLINTGSLQSPIYTGSRTESVNYETGNAFQGCSIGWIGSGASNNLPQWPADGTGGDELDFGLRLPRAVNGANETGGFVLPLKITAGCAGPTYVSGQVNVRPAAGDFATYGIQCSGVGPSQFTCTTTDGTVYNFTVAAGKSSILDVQMVAP